MTKLPAPMDMPRRFAELVRMAPPRVIHDEQDYENAQETVDRLTSIPKCSRSGDAVA